MTAVEKWHEMQLKLYRWNNRKLSFIDYLLLRNLDPPPPEVMSAKDWGELAMLRWMEACGLHPGMELKPTDPSKIKDKINNIAPM